MTVEQYKEFEKLYSIKLALEETAESLNKATLADIDLVSYHSRYVDTIGLTKKIKETAMTEIKDRLEEINKELKEI